MFHIFTSQFLQYDVHVKSRIPASVALLALLAFPAIVASRGYAQFSGSAVGGHAASGAVPSGVVNVDPFTGVVPLTGSGSHVPFSTAGPVHNEHHHYRRDGTYAAPYLYPVGVPYAYGYDDNAADGTNAYAGSDDEDNADYRGGPTVFDRRGDGANSYVPPVEDVPAPHADQNSEANSASPDTPQNPTLLVFKDGRKIEVENYAIVGPTLFDLTPGHPRRVALADLDLKATEQQNENQGVVFQVPPEAN